MLDCAIGYYESVLKNPGLKKRVFFHAASPRELTRKLTSSSKPPIDVDLQLALEDLFADMDEGYAADLATDEFIFTLYKHDTFLCDVILNKQAQ